MPFGNFTRTMIERDLGLTIREAPLFPAVPKMPVPADFLRFLQPGVELAKALDNEKAKSEFIIAPVLLRVREELGRSFGLFSGIELDADAARGLNGICDFIVSKSTLQLVLEAPVLVIVEAKNDNIHNGLWQAIAAAYAAGLVNQAAGKPLKATYGAVTTGMLWLFLKVEGSDVTFDNTQYTLGELDKVFGILKYIIETA